MELLSNCHRRRRLTESLCSNNKHGRLAIVPRGCYEYSTPTAPTVLYLWVTGIKLADVALVSQNKVGTLTKMKREAKFVPNEALHQYCQKQKTLGAWTDLNDELVVDLHCSIDFFLVHHLYCSTKTPMQRMVTSVSWIHIFNLPPIRALDSLINVLFTLW